MNLYTGKDRATQRESSPRICAAEEPCLFRLPRRYMFTVAVWRQTFCWAPLQEQIVEQRASKNATLLEGWAQLAALARECEPEVRHLIRRGISDWLDFCGEERQMEARRVPDRCAFLSTPQSANFTSSGLFKCPATRKFDRLSVQFGQSLDRLCHYFKQAQDVVLIPRP